MMVARTRAKCSTASSEQQQPDGSTAAPHAAMRVRNAPPTAPPAGAPPAAPGTLCPPPTPPSPPMLTKAALSVSTLTRPGASSPPSHPPSRCNARHDSVQCFVAATVLLCFRLLACPGRGPTQSHARMRSPAAVRCRQHRLCACTASSNPIHCAMHAPHISPLVTLCAACHF